MNKAVVFIVLVFSLGNVLGNHQLSMMASPMGRPPSAGMRSASMMASPMGRPPQPLPAPPPPASNGGPAMMGQRQASQPSMMASPMGRPPLASMRSASIQKLSHQSLPAPPPPAGNGGPAMMGQYQASQPALIVFGKFLYVFFVYSTKLVTR